MTDIASPQPTRRDFLYIATATMGAVGAAAVEIEFGGDIRVRMAASVPAELARAVIKALDRVEETSQRLRRLGRADGQPVATANSPSRGDPSAT